MDCAIAGTDDGEDKAELLRGLGDFASLALEAVSEGKRALEAAGLDPSAKRAQPHQPPRPHQQARQQQEMQPQRGPGQQETPISGTPGEASAALSAKSASIAGAGGQAEAQVEALAEVLGFGLPRPAHRRAPFGDSERRAFEREANERGTLAKRRAAGEGGAGAGASAVGAGGAGSGSGSGSELLFGPEQLFGPGFGEDGAGGITAEYLHPSKPVGLRGRRPAAAVESGAELQGPAVDGLLGGLGGGGAGGALGAALAVLAAAQ